MATQVMEAVFKASGVSSFQKSFAQAEASIKKFNQAGQKIKQVGSTMTKAFTLPIVGAGAAAIKLGSDFDDQMSLIQGVTGATVNEMEKLRAKARELGKDTRYSASQVAEAQENLARAGFSTSEILSALEDNLNLATAGSIDLSRASEITASTIRGFGLEASEAKRVADTLAYTASATKTDINGLGESFSMVAPVANALNLDMEEVSAAIGILGDNAIEGSQAGNMLKRGLLNLSAPTKQQSDLMSALGMSFFDANGQMKPMKGIIEELEGGLEGMSDQQRTAALSTLFGAQAVSGWTALVNTGSEALGDLEGNIRSADGYAADFAETAEDNLGGSFRSLRSSLEELALSFYEMGDGAVRDLVDKFTDLIDRFSGLDDATKQQIIVIAGVVAALGPLLMILGSVMQGVSALAGALGFLLSPAGLVIAAIVALVAVGVLLWKNWDTIKEKAQQLGDKISEVWESIKTWTSETWESVKTAITDAVMGAWNAITKWFGQLPTWFSETWSSIVESVTEWATSMIEKAIEVGTQFVENITTFFSELPYNVGFFLGEATGTVIQWGIDMWNKAKETGSNFIEAITTFFSELPGRVSGFLTTTRTNVTTWATKMWTKAKETGANFINGIVEWFSQLPGRISTWITNAYNNVATWASNMATKAKQAGSDFINGVITFVQTLPGKIQTWLTDTISRLTTWASNMGNKGREAGTDLLNKTVNAVKELPGKMATAGADVVKGFWNGITSLGGWITDKVNGFFSGIVDGVKSKLKIFSPSRVFRDEIGKMIVKGFGQGIERNEKEAINPMERMLDNVIGVFDSQTSGLGATFSVTGEGNIANAMNRALDVDMSMMDGHVSHSVRGGNVGGSINVTQYITSPNALNEREMQRRSRLELQKLGVDFAY